MPLPPRPPPCTSSGAVQASFRQLCGEALGAADYISLASTFHTLILTGVPKLSLNDRNELRRFILLVDELYQHNVKLIVQADADLDSLFSAEAAAFDEVGVRIVLMLLSEEWIPFPFDHPTHLPRPPPQTHGQVFAFDRTRSRLSEMQSPGYLQGLHATQMANAAESKAQLVAILGGSGNGVGGPTR